MRIYYDDSDPGYVDVSIMDFFWEWWHNLRLVRKPVPWHAKQPSQMSSLDVLDPEEFRAKTWYERSDEVECKQEEAPN